MLKLLKKGDIIILLSVVLLSFLPLLFLKNEFNSDNAKIIVSQNSNVIASFDLNRGSNSVYLDFEFEVDGEIYKGKLESKNSMVRLLRLPEKIVQKSIHEDMSWIGDDSKIIVALPIKLVISIADSNQENEVDDIAT